MKLTKFNLIAALIAGVMLAGSPALRAQENKDKKDAPKGEGRPSPEAVKERQAKMAEELKLTEDQKPKVEAAQKEQMEKVRALRDDTSLTQEQKREKFTAAREDMSKKMKGILSAEQYDKWEKMTAAARGGEGKKGKKKTDN